MKKKKLGMKGWRKNDGVSKRETGVRKLNDQCFRFSSLAHSLILLFSISVSKERKKQRKRDNGRKRSGRESKCNSVPSNSTRVNRYPWASSNSSLLTLPLFPVSLPLSYSLTFLSLSLSLTIFPSLPHSCVILFSTCICFHNFSTLCFISNERTSFLLVSVSFLLV